MLFYAITIENYFETLTKSKKFKNAKKNEKTFKSFTKKLNTVFNETNTGTLKAYVYQLEEHEAKILGAMDDNVYCTKEMVKYVAKAFNLPNELNCNEIDEAQYTVLLNLALKTGSFTKKLADELLMFQTLESYCNETEESNAVKNSDRSKEEKTAEEHSYKDLKALIGLDSVKSLADQIIASTVMDKKRSSIKNHVSFSSKHMIFTGEPGSAKTTVARLLAGALKETGALTSGAFVECGRQDLVGKYTGWTATQVAEKFEEAKGGVLFIDEAYSLASNDDFGPEAINTIVQEMENHRNDVIVIFAGYPDKMEKFLDENQGLRSRIAFHVDFPNYSVNELVAIFKKMTNEKGFTMEEDGVKAVEEMCKAASKVPDFGNGRFVRNILEQAILKQSQRLFGAYGNGEVPELELFTLKKEDINFNYSPFKDNGEELPKKVSIGFVA